MKSTVAATKEVIVYLILNPKFSVGSLYSTHLLSLLNMRSIASSVEYPNISPTSAVTWTSLSFPHKQGKRPWLLSFRCISPRKYIISLINAKGKILIFLGFSSIVGILHILLFIHLVKHFLGCYHNSEVLASRNEEAEKLHSKQSFT